MAEDTKVVESSDEIKFTEEELTQVQNIQKSYSNVQNQFGQISVAQVRLEEQEHSLAKEHENLVKSLKKIFFYFNQCWRKCRRFPSRD